MERTAASQALSKLAPLRACWTVLRSEAQAALAERRLRGPAVEDPRAPLTIPLLGKDAVAAAQTPITTALARSMGGVRAAALSILPPGAHTPARSSNHTLWTVLLCLQGGGANQLRVDGVAHDLADGDALLIAPTSSREARNDGDQDRIFLLLLIDPPRSAIDRIAAGLIGSLFGSGRVDVAESLCRPDVAARLIPLAASMRQSFADLAIEIDDIVSDGSRVACFWRARGTHSAYFYNVPATGTVVTWTVASLFVFDDGKVIDMKVSWDLFTILQQLRAALRA